MQHSAHTSPAQIPQPRRKPGQSRTDATSTWEDVGSPQARALNPKEFGRHECTRPVILPLPRSSALVYKVPRSKLTGEENCLLTLRDSRPAGSYRDVGLDRPDIVCYLNEGALREIYPTFPGWTAVLETFQLLKGRPSFKPWLGTTFGVEFKHSGHIEAVLKRMRDGGHEPAGELTRKVNELLASWPQLVSAR